MHVRPFSGFFAKLLLDSFEVTTGQHFENQQKIHKILQYFAARNTGSMVIAEVNLLL